MSHNIDHARIEAAYANMYDPELLEFAKNEGLQITADAFLILKKELNKRKIGAEILQQIEHEIILQASLKSKRLGEDLNKTLFNEAIEYSLNQKQNGASDYDIYAGLVEMGVSEEYSNYIVNKLPGWIDKLHKDSKTELQAAVGILLVGTVVTYIAISIERFEIGAAMIILIGIVKIVLWAGKKNRYKKALDNIENEDN